MDFHIVQDKFLSACTKRAQIQYITHVLSISMKVFVILLRHYAVFALCNGCVILIIPTCEIQFNIRVRVLETF